MTFTLSPWPTSAGAGQREIPPAAIHVHGNDGPAQFYVTTLPVPAIVAWPDSPRPSFRIECDPTKDGLVATFLEQSLTGNSDICLGQAIISDQGRHTWPQPPRADADAEISIFLAEALTQLRGMSPYRSDCACETRAQVFSSLRFSSVLHAWHIPLERGWVRILEIPPFETPPGSVLYYRAHVTSDFEVGIEGRLKWVTPDDISLWGAYTHREVSGPDLPEWTKRLAPLLPGLR